MGLFESMEDALASVAGITSEVAGFVLGAILVVVLLIAVEWALGGKNANTMLVSASVGIVISTLVGWFPTWVIVFIALVVVLVVVNPFKGEA